MKRFLLLIQAAVLLFTLQSCIQDEELNAECDIEGVDPTWLNEHPGMVIGNPLVNQEKRTIDFTLEKGTDRTALNPRFLLSDAATITAEVDGQTVNGNGITRNFKTPQIYWTHSQDGKWQKYYTVSFGYFTGLAAMNFDHYQLDANNKYYIWNEVEAKEDESEPDKPLNCWSSGNGGYVMVGIAKTPLAFPTAPFTDDEMGACVRLQTCRTGSFGDMVKMPIAAGSLFIGTFDNKIAMKRPREATAFGLQLLDKVPKSLEGYYRYSVGETFTDKDKKVCPDRRDTADIYAVVYEAAFADVKEKNPNPNGPDSIVVKKLVTLNGDNVLTSDRIVMMARIDNPGEPTEWTHFSEPFKFKNGHTAIDPDRLALKGYVIAVVATSSRQGAYFEGAIGSVLDISQFRLVYE